MSDTLSEVLAVTRLKGTVYFSAELRAPWGVALPQRPRAPFYVVTRGRCEITLDGAASASDQATSSSCPAARHTRWSRALERLRFPSSSSLRAIRWTSAGS